MKSVNFSISAFAKLTLLATLLTGICACNTTATKKTPQVEVTQRQLVSTAEYIPVQVYDKENNLTPYVAQANPYSTQKGRLKKENILLFIDAKRAFTAKQFDQAEALLKTLIAQQPKLSGPWVILGDIAIEKNTLSEAKSHYSKAIEVNVENINAYLRLALTQRKRGKYLAAQNTYASALQQWQDFPEAHLNLGILYDIYLNHPIRAQRHLEAYQFLTQGENKQAAQWLDDIQSRTGLAIELPIQSDELAQQGL